MSDYFTNLRNMGSTQPAMFLPPPSYQAPISVDKSYLESALPTADLTRTLQGIMPNVGTVDLSWFDNLKLGASGAMSDMGKWLSNQPLATTTAKDGTKTQGLFDMGLGTAQGLLSAYLGFQNLGIAKDTLNQNKRQFDLNFDAQRKMTNSRLADRQATRLASGTTSTSVADYMKQYGI